MSDGYLVGSIDVAELAFFTFVLFFVALIFWLRREDRREGYPLEDELTGALDSFGGPLAAAPAKTFHLPFGRGAVTEPFREREPVDIAAKRVEYFGGAPIWPTGNPLIDGIGPAGYADRAKFPDQDMQGRPRIVPLSTDPEITLAARSPDPRGMNVIGADGMVAGTVTDLWVDRSDHQVRYLDVATADGGRALAPMAMAILRSEGVVVDAINAADFAAAPVPATPGEITRYEEERVVAYFGGGYLYANADRQEPWL